MLGSSGPRTLLVLRPREKDVEEEEVLEREEVIGWSERRRS